MKLNEKLNEKWNNEAEKISQKGWNTDVIGRVLISLSIAFKTKKTLWLVANFAKFVTFFEEFCADYNELWIGSRIMRVHQILQIYEGPSIHWAITSSTHSFKLWWLLPLQFSLKKSETRDGEGKPLGVFRKIFRNWWHKRNWWLSLRRAWVILEFWKLEHSW